MSTTTTTNRKRSRSDKPPSKARYHPPKKQAISASAAQYHYNTRLAATRSHTEQQHQIKEAMIIKYLNQDMIEYMASFLDLLPSRIHLSQVNKIFKSYHYENNKPLVFGMTPNRLYSASTCSKGGISLSALQFLLNRFITPVWTKEHDTVKPMLPMSKFYPHYPGDVDGPYFALSYIGKLYINLANGCSLHRLKSIAIYTELLHKFRLYFTSLFFIDMDLSMLGLSHISPFESNGRYQVYRSNCYDIETILHQLFKSFKLFDPTLKMISITTKGKYSILPILTSLHKLPPNIKYFHSIPPIDYVAYIVEQGTNLLVNYDTILQKTDWNENPYITALVQTAPSWNDVVNDDDQQEMLGVDDIAWRRLMCDRLQTQLFIVLRQLPNLKALHVSTTINMYQRTYPELRNFACFQSLQRISINAHVDLWDFAWMPNLQQLRCGATIASEEFESHHLEFKSLTLLEIATVKLTREDSMKWVQYFKRFIVNKDTRNDDLVIEIMAFMHPFNLVRSIDESLCVSNKIVLHWQNAYSYHAGKVLAEDDTQEEFAIMNIDFIFDNYMRHEVESFIQYSFAQDEVGTQITGPKRYKDMTIPECLLRIPCVPRPESPIVSDGEGETEEEDLDGDLDNLPIIDWREDGDRVPTGTQEQPLILTQQIIDVIDQLGDSIVERLRQEHR